MPKKRPGTRRLVRTPEPHDTLRNIPEKDLYFFAQASHKAAKTLAGALQPDANPFDQFDIYPVIFMYRHALEVHLKALVFEGSNFLATKPDHLSVGKTRSVCWLAQFVVQIVAALGWQEQFRCEGIDNLADFKKIIEEVNSIDPGFRTFRFPGDPQGEASVVELHDFVRRLDALLDLLDSTVHLRRASTGCAT